MSDRILIIGADESIFDTLDELDTLNLNIYATDDITEALDAVEVTSPHVIFLDEAHIVFLEKLQQENVDVPTVVLGASQPNALRNALDAGAIDCLPTPVAQQQLQSVLSRAFSLVDAQRHRNAFRVVSAIGEMMSAREDVDDILNYIVQYAARLAAAEEATLMLFSEETGQLSIRAAANVDQDPASIHQLVDDKIAMHVVLTGQPLIVNARPGQHIKTRYLVNNLLYIPVTSKSRPIGVLGVHNRIEDQPISERRLEILETLADFAATAIVNQLEPAENDQQSRIGNTDLLVRDIPVPMLVVDNDDKLLMCNTAALPILNKGGKMNPVGNPIKELTTYETLLELIELARMHIEVKGQLVLNDSRVFQVNISKVSDNELAVAMYDITRLNKRYENRGELINTMSHDLRSPLTAILSYVELMARVGELNERQLEFAGEVRRSVKTITTLLEDILNLERNEDETAIQRELIPTVELLREAADSVQSKAQLKRQWFDVDLTGDLPQIVGNRVRLRQAFVNLIDNAVKYTPEGGVIKVTAQYTPEQVFIHIIDNGIGIPTEDQLYVFDKFFRVDEVAESHDGTGLGLNLVKSIVESHNGRIWVESEPGVGSSFIVVLPTQTATQKPPA